MCVCWPTVCLSHACHTGWTICSHVVLWEWQQWNGRANSQITGWPRPAAISKLHIWKYFTCIIMYVYAAHCSPSQDTGFTALMFACKKGHLDTVSVLLEHSATTNIHDKVSLKCNEHYYTHVHCSTVISPAIWLHIQAGMTAAGIAFINQHSDVCSVLQPIASQDTTATEELKVSINRLGCIILA